MNFVPLALSAIKSSFCGDYATPRSHCFSLSALDASVHFGIRSLAQHKLCSPDYSVHRGSSCSYRRSVVQMFRSLAGLTRTSRVCLFTSLGQPRTPSRRIFRSRSPRRWLYFDVTQPDEAQLRTKPNHFRLHLPITMRCTGAAGGRFSCFLDLLILHCAATVIATVI